MKTVVNSSGQPADWPAFLARVLSWFFLINFVLNAVQLIVYGLAPLLQPESVRLSPDRFWLSAFFTVICLMLAIGLRRIANRAP